MPHTRPSTDFVNCLWCEFPDPGTRTIALDADLASVVIEPATDAPGGRRW
jgi:hypothetical protein